jgi:hypothetical protein
MTTESDEELEMIMNQRSRFSRYRMRVREKNNVDLNEAMMVNDDNMILYAFYVLSRLLYYFINYYRANATTVFEQSNSEFVNEAPTTKHDQYTQTSDSSQDIEIEQCIVGSQDDNDGNQLYGNGNIFSFHNDLII